MRHRRSHDYCCLSAQRHVATRHGCPAGRGTSAGSTRTRPVVLDHSSYSVYKPRVLQRTTLFGAAALLYSFATLQRYSELIMRHPRPLSEARPLVVLLYGVLGARSGLFHFWRVFSSRERRDHLQQGYGVGRSDPSPHRAVEGVLRASSTRHSSDNLLSKLLLL